MKKRNFKIGHLPKYRSGGPFDPKNPFGEETQAALEGLPQLDEAGQFLESSGANKGKGLASGIAGAASSIPGWGSLIGAGIQLTQGIDDSMKDEFGIYKSAGREALGTVLNPVGTISNLIAGGPSQSELKQKKKVFDFQNMNSKMTQNAEAGAMMKNSLPVYQAPAYGEQGLKLRVGKRYSSKFSNFK